MDATLAIRTLDALANGADPLTGKAFPEGSPYDQPVVLRALFLAIKALQQPASADEGGGSVSANSQPLPPPQREEKGRARRAPPSNAGKPWTSEEDGQLCGAFDNGVSVKELAARHLRSTVALNARLFKLGKIGEPGIPLRGRPAT